MSQYSGVPIVKAEYVSVWLTVRRFAEIFNLFYSICTVAMKVIIPIFNTVTVDPHLTTLNGTSLCLDT